MEELFNEWLNDCPVNYELIKDNTDTIEYKFIIPITEETV